MSLLPLSLQDYRPDINLTYESRYDFMSDMVCVSNPAILRVVVDASLAAVGSVEGLNKCAKGTVASFGL